MNDIIKSFLDQLSVQVSTPVCIFFFIAFGLSLFQFHIKSRRRMLMTKFIGDSNYATYYFLMGAIPGCLGSLIAGLGGLIQALTPDRLMKKTRYARLSLAIILASIGIYFTAQKTNDMLPLVAVIFGRLAELSRSPQKIRLGLMLTFPPWIIYNISHEFYLPLFANIAVGISMIWAVWRHRHIKQSAEPV